jgi:hypothetical protein
MAYSYISVLSRCHQDKTLPRVHGLRNRSRFHALEISRANSKWNQWVESVAYSFQLRDRNFERSGCDGWFALQGIVCDWETERRRTGRVGRGTGYCRRERISQGSMDRKTLSQEGWLHDFCSNRHALFNIVPFNFYPTRRICYHSI